MGGQMAFEGFLAAFFCLVENTTNGHERRRMWLLTVLPVVFLGVGQGREVARQQMRKSTLLTGV